MYTCCTAAIGVPNLDKLRLYRVTTSTTGPRLQSAEISSPLCDLKAVRTGLHLAHLPLLTTRAVPSHYRAAERVLLRLLATFHRRHPPFVLAIRCVLAYALSKLDFLHGACPPYQQSCLRIQRLVNKIARVVLRLPSTSPTAWMYATLVQGGLGVPNVVLRAQLTFLRGFYDALNSRDALIRDNLRHVWQHHHELPHVPEDIGALVTIMRLARGRLSLPPHVGLIPVAPEVVTLRTWGGSPVLLISDGSFVGNRLAWAAIVADEEGPLGHASGSLLCCGGHSTAAEWLGRAQAVALAKLLGVPHGVGCLPFSRGSYNLLCRAGRAAGMTPPCLVSAFVGEGNLHIKRCDLRQVSPANRAPDLARGWPGQL